MLANMRVSRAMDAGPLVWLRSAASAAAGGGSAAMPAANCTAKTFQG